MLLLRTEKRAEGEEWLRQLHEKYEAGLLFCTLTGFLVVGRKP